MAIAVDVLTPLPTRVNGELKFYWKRRMEKKKDIGLDVSEDSLHGDLSGESTYGGLAR